MPHLLSICVGRVMVMVMVGIISMNSKNHSGRGKVMLFWS